MVNFGNTLTPSLLIILTDDFPVGPTEPYLIDEIPELKKAFSEVAYITTSQKLGNIHLAKNHFDLSPKKNALAKWKVAEVLLHCTVWNECFMLLKKGQFSWYKLKVLLANYQKALEIKKGIQKIKHLYFPSHSVTLYSYWCDERALACALLKKQFPKIVAITRVHGWDIYTERSPENYLPYRAWLLSSLDKTICISEHGKSYLEQKHGITGKIKTELFRLGTLAMPKIAEKKTNQVFTILSLAYVIPLKRLHKIAEALALSNLEKIHWIHLGGGPEFDNLKETSQTLLGEKSNIRYDFLGTLPHDQILTYMQDHFIDLFINVSETEGLPVSIMEAMSAQIPCLATNVGGSTEIVNEENGYLMPPDLSMNQLWSKIKYHYELPIEEVQKMRMAAYRTWKEKYNAQENYSNFARRLSELSHT